MGIQMWVKIIVCYCILVCPSKIQCAPGADLQEINALGTLNRIANRNGDIQNIFRPSRGGYLGKGAFGFTFKGILIKADKSEKEVAMKFTMIKYTREAAKEYEMYTYLHAINNEHVEQYGIPSVHYFGKWDEFILMAITLLDTSMAWITDRVQELDGLIMFRDFIKSSKYIHGCGIRHDDIKPDNIMFRRNNAFIIDYNLANKLSKNSNGGALEYLPISAHLNKPRLPKDDWESFLYSMCRAFNVELKWFYSPETWIQMSKLSTEDQKKIVSDAKQNITNTMLKIKMMPDGKLKNVLWQFSIHVFANNPILPYDHVYEMINCEINLLSSDQPAILSFIKDEDRQQAMLESSTICNISSIDNPSATGRPTYPNVHYDLFEEMYGRSQNLGELIASARKKNVSK